MPIGTRIALLSTFARRVRHGEYTRDGRGVRAQTVQVALRAIGSTFEMDGKPNPTYRSEGRYLLPIQRQLKGYRRSDPAAQAKLAVPVKVVNHIHDVGMAKRTSKALAIVDVCLIAFYFLLRVGEYTSHARGANRRTVQFRARDITFWDDNIKVIPNTASLESLTKAHSVTMRIDNQKNGTRGSTIHHNALHTARCPCRALARRVHNIMSHKNGSPDDIISTYFTATGEAKVLTSNIINTTVKTAVKATGLVRVHAA